MVMPHQVWALLFLSVLLLEAMRISIVEAQMPDRDRVHILCLYSPLLNCSGVNQKTIRWGRMRSPGAKLPHLS